MVHSPERTKMKHFGMTINLKDQPDLIEQYKTYHRNVWPETLAALKEVGITKMNIYLLGRRMFMAMETVDDFDIDRDFPRYLEQHPRCREWDELMRTFQTNVPEAPVGTTWVEMKEIHAQDHTR